MNEKLREKFRPWLSASVLVGIAALGVSLGQSVLGFFDYVRVELSDNAECCRDYQAYRLEDSAQRRYWVDVITKNQDKNEQRLRELERQQIKNNAQIEVLSSNAKARPDPFTGTEGRELEKRLLDKIKTLEQQK